MRLDKMCVSCTLTTIVLCVYLWKSNEVTDDWLIDWLTHWCSQEYDFVFDIELYKDRPPLKLPYNVGDDLQLAARNFLQQNNVDERFLETVTNYIRSHIDSPTLPAAVTTVTDVSTGMINVTVITLVQLCVILL